MKYNNAHTKIALITIGDELLNGTTRDINAHWLAQFLFEKGAILTSQSVVGDSSEDIMRALAYSYAQADIVITSGGIGPTLDDKTKSIVAKFFNKKIIEHNEARIVTEDNYTKKNKTWIRGQNLYDMFPENFIPLNNSSGFAPGLYYKNNENKKTKMLFSLPGVPKEFISMMTENVFPIIQKEFLNELKPNLQTVIRTFGVPEEVIFFKLCPALWVELEKYGKVSSLPQTTGIDIIITHLSSDSNEYKINHKEILDLITKSPLNEHVWQMTKMNLPEVIVSMAAEKNLTFSFAESCTGGLVSSKITDVPGCSAVFKGSIISYANEVKINVLNVLANTLVEFTPVSIETACEMASSVREKLNTTYGVSITGIAGPGGETLDNPVGTVVIGISSKEITKARVFHFSGDRTTLKERFSVSALMELWKLITNH